MTPDEVKSLVIDLWFGGHSINHIVAQARVSPITICKWVLAHSFPDQMQNYKEASVTFNELQRAGDTYFGRE